MTFTKSLSRAIASAALLGVVPAMATSSWEYVRLPSSELTAAFVKSTGFVRDHGGDAEYAFGYIPRASLKNVSNAIQNQMVSLDAKEFARFEHDPRTLLRIVSDLIAPKDGATYENYHTYETLTSELQSLAQKYPKLVTLHSAGKSVEGRDLWYLRISDSDNTDAHKPKLLYVSSMHGDEVTGKELMIYLVREMLSSYGKDARLTRLVRNADIFIMPSMNPDGTLKQQRFNGNDADLNRDFPNADEDGASTAGRQPETVALMKLHQQNHFILGMNLHGGTQCVNIPWDAKPNPVNDRFGDDKLVFTLANNYTSHNPPMHAHTEESFVNGVTYGYEWYQVLGGMQDWSINFTESTHVTTELSDIKWPDASELPTFWSNNRESMIGWLDSGITGFHLQVTDENGQPVSAAVDIGTAKRTLHYTDGFVHRPAVDGAQTVTVAATGYQTQTLNLTPEAFEGKYTTVVLKK